MKRDMSDQHTSVKFYVGSGKYTHEEECENTEVRLWNVDVNGNRLILRGTEHRVMQVVCGEFYYEDWHVGLRKCLALSSEIIEC